MGAAMLAGWRERGLAPSIVVDPAHSALSLAGPDMRVVAGVPAIPPNFSPAAVVLAIKPQNASAVLPLYRQFNHSAVFLSIMAGKTLAGMQSMLGRDASIVRAMPNTPAAVRRGMTVACAGSSVNRVQRLLCDALLEAVGEVAWVQDEAQLDAVTAVSGSGPAYVFLLAELLEQAALHQGLPPVLARQLARATIAGSGALLEASPEDSADLRKAVTSPGGTTERALSVLMAPDAWPKLVDEAVAQATARSRELAS